jgi:enamine deaminase RidA (YjgF/YER057c/UK114 family)
VAVKIEPIEPSGWPRPRGYADGILATGASRTLFVAGQIAWDEQHRLVGPGDFAAQFAQSLRNAVAVVRAAGGWPDHIVRMTIYVVDKRQYLAHTVQIRATWREILGNHYPAMSLFQVSDLLEPGALVEIEVTAALE